MKRSSETGNLQHNLLRLHAINNRSSNDKQISVARKLVSIITHLRVTFASGTQMEI